MEKAANASGNSVTAEEHSTPTTIKEEKFFPAAITSSVVYSNISEASFSARKKQLELRAAQAKALIDKEIIEKQLAADIAALEDECGQRSNASVTSRHHVEQWMTRSEVDATEQLASSGPLPEVDRPAPPPSDLHLLTCALKDALLSSAAHTQTQLLTRLSTSKDLPTFIGDPLDWLQYREAYTESTQLCKYSDAENLWRLRKSLQGEAKETVSSLLIGNTSPAIVIETLELRYGRPEIIISKITAQLKRMTPLPPAYHVDIVNFAIKVRNYVAAAKAVKQTDYLRSPELMAAILTKCPSSLISKWTDYYSACDKTRSKMENFAAFLYNESTKVTEAGVSCAVEVANDHQTDRRTRPFMMNLQETSKRCGFCNGNCEIPNCAKFKRAMRRDRWRYVKGKHLCQKCLKGRHNKDQCPASNCDVEGCDLPHHRLLHWPAPAAATTGRDAAAAADHRHAINTVDDADVYAAADGNIDAEAAADNGFPGNYYDTMEPLPTSDTIQNEIVTNTVSVNPVVMLKIVPIKIRGPKGTIDTHALLDDGATISLISSDIAETVGLKGRVKELKMRGAWDSNEISCTSEILTCDIRGKCSNIYQLHARKIKELDLPLQRLPKVYLNNFDHLKVLDKHISEFNTCKPKVLIGQDNYDLIKPLKIISGKKYSPYATLTPLGWCIHGFTWSQTPLLTPASEVTTAVMLAIDNELFPELAVDDPFSFPRENEPSSACNVLNSRALSPAIETSDFLSWQNDYLHELVRKSFAIESLGVSISPPRINKDEAIAIQILDETSELTPQGHWVVGLPWKGDSNMPESYPNAYKRLRSCERKMNKDPAYANRYRDRIAHLFDNGYAGNLSQSKNPCRVWYLPHFGVDNPNKNKLRLVFDCASATTGGFSLNSYLLQGPDLLQSLTGIMLRFREYPIGVSGDIKDMFLRIKINDDDQHALRFLWRNDPSKPVQTFAMKSLIFGANCSPFIAQYIKNKNAMRFNDIMPEAVETIIKGHYMDDCVDSFKDQNTAIKIVNEVTFIHKSGDFEIRNWTSNDEQLCKSMQKEALSQAAVDLSFEKDSFERTLGFKWYPSTDTLAFNLSMHRVPQKILNLEQKPTKRQLLSIVMSIYDIYGYLSPFTIQAKIIIQSTWKNDIGWDQEIADEMFVIFQAWMVQLQTIKELRFPRWYFRSSQIGDMSEKTYHKIELHVFCDASPVSFAAVAYWRVVFENTSTETGTKVCVSFIMSKARVAPIKPMTIPRLELQAAVLGCRLADTIKKEHRLQVFQTFYWTDSTTVLQWIRNNKRNYNTFVANRLGEIDEKSSCVEWHYVPTTMNIADVATKINSYRLSNDCEWFCGPKFLNSYPMHWPVEPKLSEHSETVQILAICYKEEVYVPMFDVTRFSSWLRCLRSAATVLLFIDKCKKKNFLLDTLIIQKAEIILLKDSQQISFPKEIKALSEGKSLPRESRLLKLTPIIDKHGLLRVDGRIGAAKDVELGTKMPIILDGGCPIAKLIVTHYHRNTAHSWNETVVNEIRQKYWILNLRPTVRNVASKCLLCRIRKAQPRPPRLGDLPEARLMHHQRVFTNCGIDIFGPIEVAIGRQRLKRYGVLFTCLTVRAVHIEIVASLTTDSFIMALRRMAARRGWPKTVYSDNGTNLRGAEAELKRAIEVLDKDYVKEYATNIGIDWHFIPPVSPHMGGAWERLIRSVKSTLKVILNERAPREETLTTLLLEVENIINSRPITYVSSDHRAPEALTPNHFLIGSSSNLPLSGVFNDGDLYLRRQWRIAQRLSDLFWQRWVKEALPLLIPRSKWLKDEELLNIGDVVIIVDPSSPRNTWPLGIIEKSFKGKDGRIRVVDVRTQKGILRRPVTRVALLPRMDECRIADTRGDHVENVTR